MSSDPLFHDDMPLSDARATLRTLVDVGHQCPCCRQFSKVYRRKLNSGQAAGLIRFYRAAGTVPAHGPTLGLAQLGGEFARLRFWGLVEQPAGDDAHSGLWRVTDLGRQFVRGDVTMPAYAHIYDGACLRLSGPEVSIVDALGSRFDYHELMVAPGLAVAA